METFHRRTCVYQIGYHLVFCTKYRKDILSGVIADSLKGIIFKTAAEKGFTIATLEANKDHVHLFVSAPPHISISILVKWIKGISARKLFVAHPSLRKKLYRGHLWNPSFYVGTVGDMSENVVRKYIESQTKRA
jgi:putative transposase